MTSLSSFVLPAILGLVAGVGHGVISHNADLPMSLSDQLLSGFSAESHSDSASSIWGEE